ncbi:hypothetical protein ACIGXM_31920 [Kitasatospora sp. NPDC052896]|uniref:hypothetical protein n=1 Tax=Kitasatospora sp. NPDC052896 TaxID=3364061 RepID=UPI0037C5DE17
MPPGEYPGREPAGAPIRNPGRLKCQAPSALVHYDTAGGLTWTSVYTVNAADNHLNETYLSGIGANWISQDLSAKYGTPPV